jgi:UDP-3-O-[3-hydroxymyristoyl] glucosamine N-acyltransferase
VGQDAVLGNRVHIGSHSRIGSRAHLGHGIHLGGDTVVPEGEARGVSPKPPHKARARRDHSRMAA